MKIDPDSGPVPEVADFTSALYLDLRHGPDTLGRWHRLTVGAPAALSESARSRAVARRVARLVGCEAGLCFASTLHAFADLFENLAHDEVEFLVDAGAYGIARRALRIGGARTPLRTTGHYDVLAAQDALRIGGARTPPRATTHYDVLAAQDALRSTRARPVLVADGSCPACVTVAPIREWLELLAPRDGLLVLDDTQALGILGPRGGGVLRALALHSDRVVLVSSLAKAFGAPMASLAGSADLVTRLTRSARSRSESSPPSEVDLLAAWSALEVNRRHGDELRKRLRRRVRSFRRGLEELGLSAGPGDFPMRLVDLGNSSIVRAAHLHLGRSGIRTAVVEAPHGQPGEHLLFVLRARQRRSDLERALEGLREVLDRTTPRGEVTERSRPTRPSAPRPAYTRRSRTPGSRPDRPSR